MLETLQIVDLPVFREVLFPLTLSACRGLHADELDVILSRVKLAQLLGRGEGT